MSTPQYKIDVRGIRFVRDHRLILDNVEWQVAAGQHWAVLGVNGSGKTTLLNIATGYLWPTDGSVRVLGHQFGNVDLRVLRRRIGFVSAALGNMIHRDQPVRNIVLSGAFGSTALFDAPTAAQVRLANRLMKQVNCSELADSDYGTLSLGEQQRVLIARALMARPKLLILDEACAGLDIPSRESVINTVNDLAEEKNGPTMILVTHHIEEIPPSVSHVLVLRGGKVLAQGVKQQVLTPKLLGQAFSLRLGVQRKFGRYWPHVIASR